MDRSTKINKVLAYQTRHDNMFDDAHAWKKYVLLHFNQIYRKEIGMRELVQILQDKGVSSATFSDTLWKYPIRELLEFIAKLSDITDLEILPHTGQRFFLMHKTSEWGDQTLHIMDTFKGVQLHIRENDLEGLVSNDLYTEAEIKKLKTDIKNRI